MRYGGTPGSNAPEMDVERIQQMLSERDGLRKKINDLGFLDGTAKRLSQPSAYASGDLAKNFEAQSKYIQDMECDIQDMQKYYEGEVEQSKYNEELLRVS